LQQRQQRRPLGRRERASNIHCAVAARRYRDCLADAGSFEARTLDDIVQAIQLATGDGWIDAVHDRYLDPVHLLNAGMPPLETHDPAD
jgi:hypothetical protein